MNTIKHDDTCSLLFQLVRLLGWITVDGWQITLTNNGHLSFYGHGQQITVIRENYYWWHPPHVGYASSPRDTPAELPISPERVIEYALNYAGVPPEDHEGRLAEAAGFDTERSFLLKPLQGWAYPLPRASRRIVWRIARAQAVAKEHGSRPVDRETDRHHLAPR